MSQYPYPMLDRPFAVYRKEDEKREKNVSEWIQTLPTSGNYSLEKYDAVLLGVPLSRSSISASAASEAPNAMRSAWKYFSTYQIESNIDLDDMQIVDLGDVKQSITDIAQSHRSISEAMYAIRSNHPHALPVCVGGDHSVTARLIQGWKRAHPEQTIGILQFDTHFDLRPLDQGPTNGTPMRLLIEEGIVEGKHIHTLGLHGFFNSRSLKEYADAVGITYRTMNEMRRNGISRTVKESIDALNQNVDVIYVTVDMDVLDTAYAPGAPASTPGGMRTDELFEAVFLAGQSPKAAAMDIVCLDPRLDTREATVKAGVHVMLCFLTGFWDRKKRTMGQ
ncbi:formimidoylglutamase [Pseudalkalibacillus hwajinpoensis]|uniref:Formimidoylglutamase n=1 Tax=Guptibacillus hwajinpoensis TaxID=208199 RepID=A0A4U1MK31_9BACL|nr:formimidoylglutamase [Pseudalkalibacillus hwajinpoensis]TKD70954.1 formimidoylglutamase [Pseudalkalibacillus hwajinpoensis]